MNALAVTAADAIADPEPMAAELVARWCGTRSPGVLELLDMLGIDLAAAPPEERPEPVPVTWPDTYRRGRKGEEGMTGTAGAVVAGAGVVILVTGLFASVAFNSVPLAVAFTGASFGLMALFGAWVRLRGRFRFPRPRPLTGWRITAAAVLSLACGAGAVAAGFLGSAAASSVLAVLGVALWVRVAVARQAEQTLADRARRTELAQAALAEAEAAWTDNDEAILRGDVSMPAWKRAGQAARGEHR